MKSKVKVKATKAVEVKASTPKVVKNTITQLVLRLFNEDPSMKSKEMIEKVKKSFPKSKFQLSHYSWFKYQIKNEKYSVKPATLQALKG